MTKIEQKELADKAADLSELGGYLSNDLHNIIDYELEEFEALKSRIRRQS